MRINEVILHEELLDVKSVINSSIKKLDKVFKSNKHELRIVGGAVRDLALDKTPKDIDLATDATPDEMIAMLDKASIRHKPTGLEHGTITAILDNEPFEITTLRADTETDGRHAEVEFVRSWEEDAKRRDLTYNAMSMDMEGNVFDYFNGMDDLQDKVSNFVGDADERIKEDYLRILRYFRFQGRLSTPSWNEDTLKAISSNVKGLQNISAERIWQEMSKVLAGNNVANVLTHMTKSGVSKVIGLSTNDLNKVKDKGNPIIALAQMGNTTDIAKRWRLSNNEAVLLDFLVKNKNNSLDQKKVEDMIADGIDKNLISALVTIQGKDLNVDAKVPDFPITGADLIAKGMNPGPQMGAKLNLLKQQWKQSNFTATKDDLLKENSDLGTQRGRLEYYLKKPVEDGMLVHLSSLGKFHKDNDSLADIVPERNGTYALHPDKWESTFYSLTNKDFKKIVHYKPRLIKAPSDMIVADMAIANKFYRTDNPEEQDQLAKEYKDSIGKDVSSMKMPEVIISTSVNEDGAEPSDDYRLIWRGISSEEAQDIHKSNGKTLPSKSNYPIWTDNELAHDLEISDSEAAELDKSQGDVINMTDKDNAEGYGDALMWVDMNYGLDFGRDYYTVQINTLSRLTYGKDWGVLFSLNEDEVFVTLKKDDIVVKVPKRRVEYFLDRHYKIVEKITKDTPMGDVIKDFYKSDAPQFKGKSKAKKRQMAIAAKLSMNEAVHTFMTGHDVTFGGQKYDEMEIEVTGVDNANKKYNIMILTPKELFGKTVAVSSRYMERGPWTKTKTPNVFENFNITSNTGFESGFTVTLTIKGQKAGHFRYYFDEDGAQNDVEVYPEFQGKGYGKLLTLKAMTTADDYDIPFERDSRGVSKAQRGVYSSLERDGLIDNNGVTDKGYDYLEYGEKDAH